MEQLITNILNKMTGKVNIQELKQTLYMCLVNYDIKPKKCEIRVENDRWAQILQMFLDRKLMSGRSQLTVHTYGYQLSKLLSYLNKDIEHIKEADIFKYFIYYKEVFQVSNAYLDNLRLIFSSFFSWCALKNYVEKNPMDEIEPFKKDKKIKKPYSDEELEKLKEVCDNKRDRALLEFIYSTGVRVGELVNINIADIDFDNKEAVVFGKGSKERTVYLADVCVMYLKEYLKDRTDTNNALFISKKKPYTRMQIRGVQEVVQRLAKIANIKGATCHRFRRTTATNLLKKGTPLQEVQMILGHCKPETTLIYASVDKESAKNNHRKFMCA